MKQGLKALELVPASVNTYDKMTQIRPDDYERSEYLRLCKKLNLAPPSQMQADMCQHYVIKKNARTGVEKRVFLEVRPESCSMSDGHDRLQC